ncbi:MAG: hypothetical protein JWO45_702 [Spartobacteria bacterium]|nr:hypothetical protein [Spartobacteria bacterium]
MTRSRARFYSFGFGLHCFLIVAVSARETFWLLSYGQTDAPSSLHNVWQLSENATAAALAEKLNYSNPARQVLYTYLHSTGIEGGYGYFAPNVPDAYKLVFELHYPDGRVEYDLPLVSSSAGGLRMVSLLERLARPGYAPVREYAIKLIAKSVWREHPNAIMIRAIFSSITLPSMADYERGKRESYEVLSAYDISHRKDSDPSVGP